MLNPNTTRLPDTHTTAMMFFEIKFSLFFSFNLRNDNASERHQPVSNQDQGHITSPIVSQHTVEPGPMIKRTTVASAPVRPVLSRIALYLRNESSTCYGPEPETDDTDIADTHLTKASDRESLELLLRSNSQREKPVDAKAPNVDMTDDLLESSLVHHSPVTSLEMLPEGPFVVSQSPVLEDDSGSDLVSPLQRIRIGGLSSYFEEVERRARARTEASTTPRVGGGHDQRFTAGLETDQYSETYNVADGEWSEVTVCETSDER